MPDSDTLSTAGDVSNVQNRSNQSRLAFLTAPERTWPNLIRLAFFTNPETVNHEVLFLPKDKDATLTPFQCALMAGFRMAIEQPWELQSELDPWLTELRDAKSQLSPDEASLVCSIYELLWAWGELESDEGGHWLGLFTALRDRDRIHGSAIGMLGWRMVQHTKILQGYPHWQVASCWQNTDFKEWVGEDQTRDEKMLSEVWEAWFHRSPKEAKERAKYAVSRLHSGHPLHYGAVEAEFFAARSDWTTFSSGYWNLQHLRKSNDVAVMIGDSVTNLLADRLDQKSDSPNTIQHRLATTYTQQLLTERLALRYWQLAGFVESVAGFSALSLRETKEALQTLAPRLPTLNDPMVQSRKDMQSDTTHTDEPKDSEGEARTEGPLPLRTLLYHLRIALLTSPWGTPYSMVGPKRMQERWEGLEPLLTEHVAESNLREWCDSLFAEAAKAPQNVLPFQRLFISGANLLQPQHIEYIWNYTRAVYENPRASASSSFDINKMWADWLALWDSDEVHEKAYELVKKVLPSGYRAEDLVQSFVMHGPSALVRSVLDDASNLLEELESNEVDVSSIFMDYFRPVINGLLNRKDRLSPNDSALARWIAISSRIANKYAVRTDVDSVIAELQGESMTRESERQYLQSLISYAKAAVEKCFAGDNSFGGGQIPLVRTTGKSATKEQVAELVGELSRLNDVNNAKEDDLSRLFSAVNIFMRSVPVELREPLIKVLIQYVSQRRPYRSLHTAIGQIPRNEWPDASGFAMRVLMRVVREFSDAELRILWAMLREREHSVPPELRDEFAPLVIACSTGISDEHIRQEAFSSVAKQCIGWAASETSERLRPMHLFLGFHDRSTEAQREKVLELLTTLWFVIASRTSFAEVAHVAYQVGRLSAIWPDSKKLNNLAESFQSDPRRVVQHGYSSGREAGKQTV